MITRKYREVYLVALSERLVYRADFFISTLLRFIPIITTILLWSAVFDGSGADEVGGLGYTQMVGYYLLVMIARSFGSMPRLASEIAGDIRQGDLRKYLLQPIQYLVYHVAIKAAHKSVYFFMAALPFAGVFWLCRAYLPAPPDSGMLVLTLTSLLLTFLLGFFINAAIGMLGFWFLEVHSFISVFLTAQYFLSGHFFPLSLLPDTVREVVTSLPFAYETYYPTLILLQKLSHAEAGRVIGVQAFWVAVLAGLTLLLWRRGLRRYAAYGG